MQGLDFGHQHFVDGQAARGVDDQHVKEVFTRVVDGGAGNVHRVLVRRAGEPFGTGLFGHRLELFDGCGAVHVARHGEHFFLALFDQVFGEFGRGGGFTRALQASHQDHGGRLGGQIDVGHPFAHGGGQLFVDDAHQRLAGLERAHHVLAECFLFDAGHEVAHDGQRHVGLQQGHAHFAQHVLHVGLGNPGLAAHLFDEAGEFVGKG